MAVHVQNQRPWNSGLCSCFNDCKSCLCAVLCMPCALCSLGTRMGENCCTAFSPGGLVALRTKLRILYGIQGSVCGDCLTTWCCAPLSVCQMDRELTHVGL